MDRKMIIRFPGGKRVDTDYHGFTIKTDQSQEDGGDHSAPTPSSLFFAAIGACTGLYALNFCEKRNIDPARVKMTVELQLHEKTHMVEKIIFKTDLPPEFPEKYTAALVRSMNLCYVKKHFEHLPQLEFVTRIEKANSL